MEKQGVTKRLKDRGKEKPVKNPIDSILVKVGKDRRNG